VGRRAVTGVTLTVPAEVDTHLPRIATARARPLDAVPSVNLDTVTAAYRATVEGILGEVRADLGRDVRAVRPARVPLTPSGASVGERRLAQPART
jgi:hypothetical protein